MSYTEIEGGNEGRKVTWIGVVANALLIVVKFSAGILGHSQALIADAVHSVSDFLFVVFGTVYQRAMAAQYFEGGGAPPLQNLAHASACFGLSSVALSAAASAPS